MTPDDYEKVQDAWGRVARRGIVIGAILGVAAAFSVRLVQFAWRVFGLALGLN